MMDIFGNTENKGKTILITGSSGLIGSALKEALAGTGFIVKCLDKRGKAGDFGDVRDRARVSEAIAGCSGVIHLAAVSRVVEGERDPDQCWSVNVNGITNVVQGILHQKEKPWLIFSSSREVYGNAEKFPVKETQPLAPLNIYGESKVRSEFLIEEAVRDHGLKAAILRFSNVYGSLNDYEDRVVPAFIHAALMGTSLRVDGNENSLDFTYLGDVIKGILLTVRHLFDESAGLAPLNFVTGRPTTLRELAELIIEITGSSSVITEANARDYDVARFHGCIERAGEVLGWYHTTSLETGLRKLAALHKAHLNLAAIKV
jgi:UDP-glucose 4-epimerase